MKQSFSDTLGYSQESKANGDFPKPFLIASQSDRFNNGDGGGLEQRPSRMGIADRTFGMDTIVKADGSLC